MQMVVLSRKAATRMRLAMLVAVMLAGGSVPASAQTTGELLAQCEQLERTWVIEGKEISIRGGGVRGAIDAGKCWGYCLLI